MLRIVTAFVFVLPVAMAACSIPEGTSKVFADMHDGDQKQVSVSGGQVTIVPNGNNQTWTIGPATLSDDCTALVDFDVEGKPDPPPVPLLLTLYELLTASVPTKAACGFTDPSGTLAGTDYPLNYWIEIVKC
mmetsp:Transcript_45630/g.92112  ORF Transcript_45630/g.92112 Transcript_45630/m.92112 type:complete len:132 (+) Transcript_45630:85-480(+)